MTATVSYAPALEGRPSPPCLRMSPALTGSAPAPLESLKVIPPQTTPVSAAWLMSAASDPLRTSTTGRLMDEAARLRTVAATDRAVEAVWDAESGHEARGPTSRPRIPAVALPTPNPAKGV